LDKGKAKQDEQYYFYDNLIIRREYGDLIIWRQIIEEAKKRGSQHIAFVTDDDKDDWWWTYKGKTIGPRPELVAEIRNEAGVSVFHMYNSPRFLKYAQEYLGAQISQESIAQVREISQLRREELLNYRRALREAETLEAVQLWLSAIQYPNGAVSYNKAGFPDFIVEDGASRVGYDVKYLSDPRAGRVRLNDWIYRGARFRKEIGLELVKYAVVLDGEENARRFSGMVSRYAETLPEGIDIAVGYIGTNHTTGDRPVFVPVTFSIE
jgi:hypothetical protein